ncbi:MAG TPA: rRNA adenine N(6)-methyltransferase family protein [Acidimicrobiales bacterium]|nr:rRNA adenine N(6)-methyltransferase family protein [Acidimicrobiales bacterium]
MSADKRTRRDEQRRRLGQNFLRPDLADELVAGAAFAAGDHVIEIGAGRGALTYALARRGVRVVALEKDPHWAASLRHDVRRRALDHIRVVCCDALDYPMPRRPFRIVGSLPFGATTAILRHLLDDPDSALVRADLIVQWEVARKRAVMPPSTLLSATWAPWWTFDIGRRIPAASFRPMPSVDAAMLRVSRRNPPILPPQMAGPYASFVRSQWQ